MGDIVTVTFRVVVVGVCVSTRSRSGINLNVILRDLSKCGQIASLLGWYGYMR